MSCCNAIDVLLKLPEAANFFTADNVNIVTQGRIYDTQFSLNASIYVSHPSQSEVIFSPWLHSPA
jgi:hypothetical protein